jgi:diaminohydroxyphosphoribosylaminopyrimidine deaminase/5-amino-6-(5-phosphoribosylamino)uracil reductase
MIMKTKATAAATWMQKALALAEKGAGFVSPNPLVGAVIVRDGKAIGQGWHARYGGPHAEAAAITDAENKGHAVTGAEIFVTLEPCAHVGKTPACADLLIKKRIAKVTYAVADPHHQASGGADKLRASGIEVISGLLEAEARWQNRFFFHGVKKQRPFFLAKAAVSADGKVAAKAGEQTMISGQEAQIFTHRLRQECDAVLVGAGTVLTDDPLLSVRHGEMRRDPLRIILDPHWRTLPSAQVYRDENYLIVSRQSRDSHFIPPQNLIGLPLDKNGRLPLTELAAYLYQNDIRSVLVEGGPQTLATFLQAGLIDELCLITNPHLRLPGGVPLLLDDILPGFFLRHTLPLGNDRAQIYSHAPC